MQAQPHDIEAADLGLSQKEPMAVSSFPLRFLGWLVFLLPNHTGGSGGRFGVAELLGDPLLRLCLGHMNIIMR